MRRRKLPPDKRLDWRDPNMPVLRYGTVRGVEDTHAISAERIQKYYCAKMNDIFYDPPKWQDDPSYFWAIKKKQK